MGATVGAAGRDCLQEIVHSRAPQRSSNRSVHRLSRSSKRGSKRPHRSNVIASSARMRRPGGRVGAC